MGGGEEWEVNVFLNKSFLLSANSHNTARDFIKIVLSEGAVVGGRLKSLAMGGSVNRFFTYPFISPLFIKCLLCVGVGHKATWKIHSPQTNTKFCRWVWTSDSKVATNITFNHLDSGVPGFKFPLSHLTCWVT